MDENTDYIIQSEPDYKTRSYNWKTAIGLQKVDGLDVSEYLITTANDNIKGEISLDETKRRIVEYYEARPVVSNDDKRTEEADLVSVHISQILAANSFKLSAVALLSIHKQLFDGVYDFAGEIRNVNLSKSEWVLNGQSVIYDDFHTVNASLEHDIVQESNFDYSTLDEKAMTEHIAKFISDLWQIHPFREGNTRTVAVFTIKYLNAFGYAITNNAFEKNSWYFRNSLVRANYNNRKRNITATFEYLNRFFGNLILGENNELKNREMQILI